MLYLYRYVYRPYPSALDSRGLVDFFYKSTVHIYLSIRHYDQFISSSYTFYPTIISSLFFFVQDYTYWMLAVTTPEKTTKDSTKITGWTCGYLLLQIFSAAPVLLSLEVFLTRRGSFLLSGCIEPTKIKINDNEFSDSTIILLAHLIPIFLRIIGGITMGVVKQRLVKQFTFFYTLFGLLAFI